MKTFLSTSNYKRYQKLNLTLAGALAYDQVIIDENGMYAYVDSGERSSSPQFGPPQKGPRECNGVKGTGFSTFLILVY